MLINKSHPLSRYKPNSGRNVEKCLMQFCPDARVFDRTLRQISFSNLYLFDSIFSIIVWTNWMQDFDIKIALKPTGIKL